MLNEGCLVSRNIYLLDCTVRTRESYVTNRASIPSLSVHISYAYELPCRSIIIPIVGHRKPKKCCRYFGSAHTLIARSLVPDILFYSIVSTNFPWCNLIITTKNHLVNTSKTAWHQRFQQKIVHYFHTVFLLILRSF